MNGKELEVNWNRNLNCEQMLLVHLLIWFATTSISRISKKEFQLYYIPVRWAPLSWTVVLRSNLKIQVVSQAEMGFSRDRTWPEIGSSRHFGCRTQSLSEKPPCTAHQESIGMRNWRVWPRVPVFTRHVHVTVIMCQIAWMANQTWTAFWRYLRQRTEVKRSISISSDLPVITSSGLIGSLWY